MKLKLTNDNLKRYHLLGTLVVVVTLALTLAASFLWIGITEHREITRRFEQNQRDHLHDRLETEMDAAVGYLDFLEVRTESVLRQALREKIAMAMQTARAIHTHESKLHPEAAVKRLILDTLRPQRFFDGRGYFFAQDQQGVSILLPINPALENTSLWDNRDDTGHYITRGLLEAALGSADGGFSRYRWYSPDNPREMSDKLAFVQIFKPYGWMIGTGDYLEQWHAARLREGLERLRAWKSGW